MQPLLAMAKTGSLRSTSPRRIPDPDVLGDQSFRRAVDADREDADPLSRLAPSLEGEPCTVRRPDRMETLRQPVLVAPIGAHDPDRLVTVKGDQTPVWRQRSTAARDEDTFPSALDVDEHGGYLRVAVVAKKDRLTIRRPANGRRIDPSTAPLFARRDRLPARQRCSDGETRSTFRSETTPGDRQAIEMGDRPPPTSASPTRSHS